ncbi:hypothetical protein PQX77_015502 [Marasmius sp. AFHP31]|nr:hypothetical protein PQX77_015502 [Marasmius sp. AFHP31]
MPNLKRKVHPDQQVEGPSKVQVVSQTPSELADCQLRLEAATKENEILRTENARIRTEARPLEQTVKDLKKQLKKLEKKGFRRLNRYRQPAVVEQLQKKCDRYYRRLQRRKHKLFVNAIQDATDTEISSSEDEAIDEDKKGLDDTRLSPMHMLSEDETLNLLLGSSSDESTSILAANPRHMTSDITSGREEPPNPLPEPAVRSPGPQANMTQPLHASLSTTPRPASPSSTVPLGTPIKAVEYTNPSSTSNITDERTTVNKPPSTSTVPVATSPITDTSPIRLPAARQQAEGPRTKQIPVNRSNGPKSVV